jgi:hypothetical protein
MEDPSVHIAKLAHRLHILERDIMQQRHSERTQQDACQQIQEENSRTKNCICTSAGRLLLARRRACLLHAQDGPHVSRRLKQQVAVRHSGTSLSKSYR